VLGKVIDVRTSVLPTNNGETVVMRLLDREESLISLEGLGFHGDDYAWFRRIIQRPHGIFLVTGPTGSGKTTTLYAALGALQSTERKLMSVEDPVEYALPGVTQIQASPAVGLGFAAALRSMLRHDPDVMMVGEIRDRETATVAIEAALTGHLVLSTLHTNSAAAAVTRLREMGAPDYLIGAAVSGVAAQRLVRRLCPNCKRPGQTPEMADMPANARIFTPVGCPACRGTGYRGRLAVAEVLEIEPETRDLILAGADHGAIERAAVAQGMTTLWRNGVALAAAGETSLEEVMRVTGGR
jgi:general secretion pathway protein E